MQYKILCNNIGDEFRIEVDAAFAGNDEADVCQIPLFEVATKCCPLNMDIVADALEAKHAAKKCVRTSDEGSDEDVEIIITCASARSKHGDGVLAACTAAVGLADC